MSKHVLCSSILTYQIAPITSTLLRPRCRCRRRSWCRSRRWRRHLARRKSRQHLVAHRERVNRRRKDDRRCLNIAFDYPLVSIYIRVPGPGEVFDRILRCTDSGKPGLVEGRAVGTAKIPAACRLNTCKTKIAERCQRIT